jgi:hypothetical protein
MCTNPPRPWPGWDGGFEYDFDSIKKRLETRKEDLLKGDILYLSGGEPTLHPQFVDVLQYINNHFPNLRIMLLTNGRTLCYDSLPQMLSTINNLSLAISLHGPSAEIHDKITGVPGSFEQACRGIENILRYQKPDREIEIRVVISKINYKKCGEILSLIRKKFPSINRVAFIFIEIEGHAIDNLKEIGVKFSDFKPILKKMVPALIAFKKAMLYHFPLCAVPEELWPYVWVRFRTTKLHFWKIVPNADTGNIVSEYTSYIWNIWERAEFLLCAERSILNLAVIFIIRSGRLQLVRRKNDTNQGLSPFDHIRSGNPMVRNLGKLVRYQDGKSAPQRRHRLVPQVHQLCAVIL